MCSKLFADNWRIFLFHSVVSLLTVSILRQVASFVAAIADAAILTGTVGASLRMANCNELSLSLATQTPSDGVRFCRKRL